MIPGKIIQALIYFNSENEPALSLKNSRLMNYKQISLNGHTSYLLGVCTRSHHPYILDTVTSKLQHILENSELDKIGFLSSKPPSGCELVRNR